MSRFLSLFSGIGLHDLGLQRAGWSVAAQCETDPWCCAVLAKHWPDVPKFEDIRNVTVDDLGNLGRIDLVTGGFPCPDISSAGRGVGLLRGERSSLWLEMLRVVRACSPAWVLAENVPALRLRGIDSVLAGLEEAGYSAWPVVVGAWAIGAPHRRDRVWIVGRRVGDTESGGSRSSGPQDGEPFGANGARRAGARAGMAHPDSGVLRLESGRLGGPGWTAEMAESGGGGEGVAESESERLEGREEGERSATWAPAWRGLPKRWPARRGEPQHPWEPPRLVESGLGGDSHGRASRLDSFARRNRLRALGNANPPHVPYLIGRWMLQFGC